MKALIPIAVVAVLSVLLTALVLPGCQPTSVTPLGQQVADSPALSDEQSAMLQEILEFQRKTGQGMTQLLDDLQAQRAADLAAKGPHPVVLDLAVARQLTAEAQKTDDTKQLTALLRRLHATLTAMQAETPAGVIIRQLERARLALALEQPSADDLSQASKALMGALDSGLGVEPAELVPPVLTRLEAAKKKLDDSDAGAARQLIIESQEQASGHQLNLLLRKALAAVRGAEEALNRDAATVVKAELGELEAMLEKVAAIAVVKTAQPEAEEATGEAAETPAEASAPTAAVPEQAAQPAPAAAPGAPEMPDGSAQPAPAVSPSPTP